MDDLRLDAESLSIPISSAVHLSERYKFLISALENKYPGAIYDQSKTLLETIFRTIITNRNGEVQETSNKPATFNELYEQTCNTLAAHDTDDLFLPIIKKVVKAIADMRNNHGASSHGQDGYTERVLMIDEAVFVARMTLSTAGYFFARHAHTSTDHTNVRLHYEDNPHFNDYLDQEGDIEIVGIFVTPSKVLFDNDETAYKEALLEYTDSAYVDDTEAAVESWIEMQSDISRGK